MADQPPRFICEPATDNPGWLRWRLSNPTLFNEAVLGPVLVRAEDGGADGFGKVRVRIIPQHHHRNNSGNIHGAVTLALIDIALFAAMKVLRDVDAAGSVTLGIDTQFIGTGNAGLPLDALVEVLRETGRLGFLRGLVVQAPTDAGETLVASFSATIRKPSKGAPAEPS